MRLQFIMPYVALAAHNFSPRIEKFSSSSIICNSSYPIKWIIAMPRNCNEVIAMITSLSQNTITSLYIVQCCTALACTIYVLILQRGTIKIFLLMRIKWRVHRVYVHHSM